MPHALHYTGQPLDRADHLREEDIRTLLSGDRLRVLPVWRGRHAVGPDRMPLWRTRPEPGPAAEAPVFLGRDAAGITWATEDLSARPPADPDDKDRGPGPLAGLEAEAQWLDLRTFGVTLPAALAATLAYARGMIFWHAGHRFCGRCGAPTEVGRGGHIRLCTNTDCAAPSFPRTDPAVIMLVTDGDRCLLGRQAQWPDGMVSTLAGFVEPGETLEEAVAREVMEEAGIRVGAVTYRASQPWPFPSSLMLGFWAAAETTAITVDERELAHAAWFHRDDLAAMGEVGDGAPGWKLPRRDSISRWLIETWRTREG
ncbi:NAD(+) diphosphatase [Caenispirillum salinarum]|uniref:NAD(+) diphosphatase n=1 Tax=Caenispirillum salinarum TaxID=859058 RepID=UPI00384BF8FA